MSRYRFELSVRRYSTHQKLTDFILLSPEALVFEILSLRLEHPDSELPAGLGN
jgi:hypothetical protein